MIIANVKSAQDLSSKRNLQKQLLELEVANEAESEKRVKNYKNPNRPTPVAPEYKTNSELQKDKILQEQQAIKNMEDLGFDYAKSAELVAWLSSSLINKLVEFNANFKGIKKELLETTNPKLINLEFVKSYLEKYFEDIDINYGRKFGKDAMSGQLAPATIDELNILIPEPVDLERLKAMLMNTFSEVKRETKQQLIAAKTDAENWIEHNFLSKDQEDDLSERQKREYKSIAKQVQKTIEVADNALVFIEEILDKLRHTSTLVDLYSAIVPSNETLNLLKTGLTQKERGDVIRRYITILKSIQFLSKDGVDEITNEIGRLGGIRNIDLDALNIGVNKLSKSLSFLTKEKGVDQITKLQRDIEVLMNQSGKLAELDKMKSINDVREQRVEEIKAALDEELRERIGEVILNRPPPAAVNLRQDARDERAKQEAIENERALAIDIYNQREQEREQLRQEQEQRKEDVRQVMQEGLTESFVGMFYDEPQIEQQQLRTPKQTKTKQGAYLPEVERVINDIRIFQRNFVLELEDMYENDETAAIATARNFLIQIKANKELYSKGRDLKTNEQYFKKLVDNIKKKGESKIRRIIKGAENGEYDIVDYDYIENANRAIRYLNKNVPSNEMTTYGIGLPLPFKKGNKEDEAELKNMAKSLRKHKAMEKKIDRYADDSSSSSDGDDHPQTPKHKLGSGSLPFKHKRVKVGRGLGGDSSETSKYKAGLLGENPLRVSQGISVKKQPAYKTFGKYVIHMGHLLDKNVANFKYPSLGSIPSIKPMTISEDYKEFIIDTLENGKPNERNFNKLDDEEQRHFERVVLGAGLIDAFKLKRNHTERERKEAERFNLLRGEVLAGNNAESVSKELRSLIVRFMNEGRIHQKEGTTMLMELATL